MATKKERLTEAEWRVMEFLWEKSPQNGRELTTALENYCGWNRSTTLTLLRRMENKGFVGSTSEGKKLFFPIVPREDAAVSEAQHLLGRVYKGSVSLMVSALTEKQAIPQEEIDELYAILHQLEEGEKNA